MIPKWLENKIAERQYNERRKNVDAAESKAFTDLNKARSDRKELNEEATEKGWGVFGD